MNGPDICKFDLGSGAMLDKSRRLHIYNIEPGLARDVDEVLTQLIWKSPEEEPIEVVLHSPGGDVLESLAVWDVIWEARQHVEVNCTVSGSVMSAGTFLMQAFDKRRITKHSIVMVHGICDEHHGDVTCLEESLKVVKTNIQTYIDVFVQRGDVGRIFWESVMRDGNPRYYTAEEAKQMGLVDEVINTGWKPRVVA